MGTRPDRKEKLEERLTTAETVVKCCLKKAICNGDNKESILNQIDKRVTAFSRRIHKASIALNLLVQEAFEKDDEPQLPEIWDPTFIRQLMLGTEDAEIPFKIIARFITGSNAFQVAVMDIVL
jgi:hypothetical protein